MSRGLLLFFILLVAIDVYSQKDNVLKAFPLPEINTPVLDFEVVQQQLSLLPLNGGLFCPESGSWYKKPGKNIYQSLSFCPSDSSLIFVGGNDKGSYIVQTDLDPRLKRVRDSSQLPQKGIFLCKKFKGDTILYGGLTNGKYAVFRKTPGGITEIFSLKGLVAGIGFVDNRSFFFRTGNSIFFYREGHKPKLVFQSKQTIDGFAVDERHNLYISRKEGIFKIQRSAVQLVLPRVHGMIKISNGYLYVLWLDDSTYVSYKI
jgi:hypothetical protein